MTISMDKKYRTRDGRSVRILCTDAKNEQYPVVALIENVGGEEYPVPYEVEGSYLGDITTQHDLVEVKAITYVKSMRQLLEEYPDACFNAEGDFFTTETYAIGPHLFSQLGKPTDDPGNWPVAFIEEREV